MHLSHNSPDHLQNLEVNFDVPAACHYALTRCRRTLYKPPRPTKPTSTATLSPHFYFGRLIILFSSDLPTKIFVCVSNLFSIAAIHFKLLSFISLIIFCGKSYKIQNSSLPTPFFNPLNPELNSICYLLALLAHHFLHVSRIRVKSLTIRLLMSYKYIYIYIYIWSTYS